MLKTFILDTLAGENTVKPMVFSLLGSLEPPGPPWGSLGLPPKERHRGPTLIHGPGRCENIDRQGPDRQGLVQTDRIQTDRVRTDRVQTDRVRTDRVQTDRVQTDRVQTDRVRTDRVQTDRVLRQETSKGKQADFAQRNELQDHFAAVTF